jgi:hypothetical protein
MDFNEVFLKHAEPLMEITGSITEAELFNNLCFYWAYVYFRVYGGQLMSYMMKKGSMEKVFNPDDWLNHAFVEKDGKYYDARHTTGVEHASLLYPDGFKFSDYQLRTYDTVDEFGESWDINKRDFHKMERSATKIKKILLA